METKRKRADEFLKQRIALVSEIDKTEFAWKKKKQEIKIQMGLFLNSFVALDEECKVLNNKIQQIEKEIRESKLKAFEKTL